MRRKNNIFFVFLKIIISSIIIFFFLLTIDFNEIKYLIKNLSLFSIFILFFLTIIRNVVGALRFKILISIEKNIPIVNLMNQYFIASLFNNFLPTAIGGDSVRLLMVSREGISKTKSALFIIIERTIGFYALLLIAFISSFFWKVPNNIFLLIFISFFLYSITIILFLILNFPQIRRSKFIKKIIESLILIQKHPQILFKILFISFLYQGISIYVSCFVASSLNISYNIVTFYTLVPLVWFFTMIPISFGGLGLREISFAYLFSFISISKEQALLISLGTYFTLILNGLIGSISLITKKGRIFR